MNRRAFLAGGAALGLAAPAILRAQATSSLKFVADYAFQGNHAIWGLALARGYFSKLGLNIVMDRGYGSGDTIVKVASGAYDIGFADVNAAVKFNASNPTRRVINVLQGFDSTLSAIITLKKSGITQPSQLPGKIIGDGEGDATRILFPAFAKANNFDPSTITWKNIAPNLRETILVQGQVEAIGGFSSTSYFNLQSAGVPADQIVMITFADHGLDLYGNAVIVREDFIAGHEKEIAAFVLGTIQGTQALIKDPDAGMAAMVARDPLFDAKLELARWKFVETNCYLTPPVKQNGFGYIDPARIDLTIKANAEAYGIANPPTPAQLYTTRFLPSQADRMPPA
jgi:NitT/TauT family transport system substrate-binding protein